MSKYHNKIPVFCCTLYTCGLCTNNLKIKINFFSGEINKTDSVEKALFDF